MFVKPLHTPSHWRNQHNWHDDRILQLELTSTSTGKASAFAHEAAADKAADKTRASMDGYWAMARGRPMRFLRRDGESGAKMNPFARSPDQNFQVKDLALPVL